MRGMAESDALIGQAISHYHILEKVGGEDAGVKIRQPRRAGLQDDTRLHLFSGADALGLDDEASLERPHIFSEITNAQVDHFLRFGVHGLEKRFPDGHVAPTPWGLACAATQDFRNSVRGVGALVVDGEKGQVGGRNGAEAGSKGLGAAILAVTPRAVGEVHFTAGSGSGDVRKEWGYLLRVGVPINVRKGESSEKEKKGKE